MNTAVHDPITGSVVPPALAPEGIAISMPDSLELNLSVDEPSMVAQLCGVPENAESSSRNASSPR